MCDIKWINTLRPRRNGQHFADDIFKCIFFNENVLISIKISLKFVPKGPISNIPALVQIMAWLALLAITFSTSVTSMEYTLKILNSQNSAIPQLHKGVDPSYKSMLHLIRYPTMHHFVTEMCTFLLQIGTVWDMGMIHCGKCTTGLWFLSITECLLWLF